MLPDPRNSPDSDCQSIWQRVERCGKLLGLSLCALGASWSRKTATILKKSWHPKVSSAGLRLICRHPGSAARPDPIAKYKLTANWTCCLQSSSRNSWLQPTCTNVRGVEKVPFIAQLSLSLTHSLSLCLSLAHSSQIRQDTKYNRSEMPRTMHSLTKSETKSRTRCTLRQTWYRKASQTKLDQGAKDFKNWGCFLGIR